MFYAEITFYTAVGVQLVYFFLFIVAFARKKNTRTITDLPPVSVVVCAHDEEQNLKELIPQLLEQHYPAFEVIVVDDRSNDQTLDWLLTETKKDARFRMVHVERAPEHVNGKKYALTLGIRAAQHEWILLTDADCRPASPNWIKQMMSESETTSDFILGYSPYQKKAGWLNRFVRFEALVTALQYVGFALIRVPYMGIGRNMAYRKSLFMKQKGFAELLSLTGGDDDLFVNKHATSKNVSVATGSDSLMHSIPKTAVREFYQQKVRHLAAGKKYKIQHRILLGLFMLTWCISWWLGIVLLIFSSQVYLIGGLLLMRAIGVYTALPVALKRLGDRFEVWSILPLDFLYSIYYLTTGTAALTTRKIKWKKN